jgi:hypothetical protein
LLRELGEDFAFARGLDVQDHGVLEEDVHDLH